jgi:homoserine kinase
LDEVRVFAPGSVSNLGPGFDCLGAAVTGKGDMVLARRAPQAGVRVLSVSDPRVPLEADRNTAAVAAAAVLRRVPGAGLELSIEKGLPLAGGLGGSAASAVAGALAAGALYGLGLPREALLGAALEAEERVAGRHADNVAPCLWGGLVLVLGLDPPVIVQRPVHASLRIVLLTPA